jgi:hypothetical protein
MSLGSPVTSLMSVIRTAALMRFIRTAEFLNDSRCLGRSQSSQGSVHHLRQVAVNLIDDDELTATMRAGRRWAAERDLPDPVNWADLVHAPAVTVGVIRGRGGGTLPAARPHTLPLPKSVGGELRPMTTRGPLR